MPVRALVLAALSAGALGCDRGTSSAPPSPEEPEPAAKPKPDPAPQPKARPNPNAPKTSAMVTEGLAVSWALERDGDALVCEHSIRNDRDSAVFVVSALVVGSAKGNQLAGRPVVNEESPGVVAVTLGYVAPPMSGGVGVVLPPVVKRLEPGATERGELRIPLPVASWHNFVRRWPSLSGAPERAVLAIGYFDSHDKWSTLRLADGSEVQVPAHPFVGAQKIARGATLAIPD